MSPKSHDTKLANPQVISCDNGKDYIQDFLISFTTCAARVD